MRPLLLLLALIVACGRPTAATAQDCQQRMLASAEYQALRGKLPPIELGTLPSLEQQADKTRATAEEARLVKAFHQKYVGPCRQEGMQYWSRTNPAAAAVLSESFTRSDASYLALVEGKITWGEYNKQVLALRNDTRAKLLALPPPGR
jgi:hypothetical protein